MAYNREEALHDAQLIRHITEGLDLNNPKDIEKIYNELQAGTYSFKTDAGRIFDDKIYDLMQKVKSGEIKDNSLKAKSGRMLDTIDPAKRKEENEKLKKKYGDSINSLVNLELKKREQRRRFLIFIAAVVALCSLGYFGVYYYMSNRTGHDYEVLAAMKGEEDSEPFSEQTEYVPNTFSIHKQKVEIPDILSEYQPLYEINNEIAGWLTIEDTKIDYPVMKTDNNDFYLKHNFYKESDNNGTLFLDMNCSIYPRSTNMIIYGHHMKSGNMFGYLQRYAKQSYWEKHKTITFDTIYEHATYEVMYVFYSKVYDNDELVFKYYQFIDANSEKEFNYYISEMQNLSLYDTGVTATYGDSLLTLSTCDHSQTDGRFAVVAKRVS